MIIKQTGFMGGRKAFSCASFVLRIMCGTEKIPCGHTFTSDKGRQEKALRRCIITPDKAGRTLPQKHGQKRGDHGINKSEGKNNSP